MFKWREEELKIGKSTLPFYNSESPLSSTLQTRKVDCDRSGTDVWWGLFEATKASLWGCLPTSHNSLQDKGQQPDGLHCHFTLFVHDHGNHPVLCKEHYPISLTHSETSQSLFETPNTKGAGTLSRIAISLPEKLVKDLGWGNGNHITEPNLGMLSPSYLETVGKELHACAQVLVAVQPFQSLHTL